MPFSPQNSNENFDDLSERELKIGYWLTVHRWQLRQSLIYALLIFDIVLGGYNLFKWGHYLAVGYWADQKMIQEIAKQRIPFSVWQQARQARPLNVGPVYVFPGRNMSDAAVLVQNPNEDFFVSFQYSFDFGGFKTAPRHGFLLPGEEKPLVEFGLAGAEAVSGGAANLSEVKWRRIDARQTGDVSEYISRRRDFEVADLIFSSSWQGLGMSRLAFDLTNNTSFNFYEPRFLILFESGGGLIGVEQSVFDRFLSGEKKSVDLRFSSQSAQPAEIKVVPDINIFSPDAYFKP